MNDAKINLWDEEDIQNLYTIALDHFEFLNDGIHEFNLTARKFGINPEDLSGTGSPESILYSFVREINDRGKTFQFLSFFVNKVSKRLVKELEELTKKYGYYLDVKNSGGYMLVPLSGEILTEESEKMEKVIKKIAPKQTLIHLHNAHENFAKGEYDDALSDCRKSLESLTSNGNFALGVTELIRERLILDGDDSRKKDSQVLRTCYGYNSSLGSHTGAQLEKPGYEQALMGMLITKSCIQLILKRLEQAKQQNIQLREWVTI